MILAWLSGAFLAGVLAGSVAPLPVATALWIAAGLAVGAGVFRRQNWHAPLLVLAALSLGLSRSPHPGGAPSPGDLSYYNGRQVTLQGVVAAEPDVRDTGINYVISASQVTVYGKTRAVSGRLELHTARSQQVDYGEAVSLAGMLREPRNSPDVPYRDILARRGIRSELSFPRLLDLGPADAGWLGWIVPLRQRLETGIDAWLPEPEAALLIAITLGARSASLGDLTPTLIATGLIHVIAISGIKVALVAGTLYQLARLLRRRLLALLLSLGGLLLYVLLTGATASGERSALMWTLVFVAAYLGRGTLPLVSLSFVAALMVAFDPSLPWDIGFQLSTLGTFFIVAFTDPLLRLARYLPSPVREAFCVTVAAQVGTLPVVVAGFHLVSGVGPLANALVLPLLPVLIVLGFLIGVFSGIGPVAAPLSAFAYVLLHAIVWLSGSLASLPSAIPASAWSPIGVTVYYAALGGFAVRTLHRVGWTPPGRRPGRGREYALALLLAASTLTVSLSYAQQQPRARLYWLGSGQARLLRADGMTALIDGSPKPFALLERLGKVLPFTTRNIDLVIVTDPRAGNVSGLQDVLAHYTVSEVLDVGAEYPSTTYARWRATLRERGIPVDALRTGVAVQVGGVTITALGPDALYPDPRDSVGLLRLSSERRTMLLAGAASRREQVESLFRPVHLAADVLSLDGTAPPDAAFVRAVRPHLVVTDGPTVGPVPAVRLRADQAFFIDI